MRTQFRFIREDWPETEMEASVFMDNAWRHLRNQGNITATIDALEIITSASWKIPSPLGELISVEHV